MKKIFVLIIIVLCITVVIGCRGGPNTRTPASTATSAQQQQPAQQPEQQSVQQQPAQQQPVQEQPTQQQPAQQPPPPATGTPPNAAPVTQPQSPGSITQQGLVMNGATSVTVVSGDTLSRIAGRVYGQSNMYYFPLIKLANQVITDPDRIYPGTVLSIPNLQANLNDAGARALIRADMLNTAGLYDRRNWPVGASELRRLANTL